MLPKTFKDLPNYLQYEIHKCWLLSWIHFIVIIRVTIFECFKMQMVINLSPVSLSNKKVNFYTCPRLTFLKKNATENAYKRISEPLDFTIFWGACPQTPLPACTFCARNLPRLVLKSGYGPDQRMLNVWKEKKDKEEKQLKFKRKKICQEESYKLYLKVNFHFIN